MYKNILQSLEESTKVLKSSLLNVSWLAHKQETGCNEPELNIYIADQQKATISLEVEIEELTFYIKRFKDIVNENIELKKCTSKFNTLTKMEKLVLSYLLQGYSSRKIADRLFLSYHTIFTHRKNLRQKLKYNSLAEIMHYKIFFS
ncbi:helix-turn-helix transcriptional regulator [Pedobacter montanisoli]|uniref:Helix-turn-helix transcriptional regulator n=1 Tax=Pedobacter montanisoli TaxID=2923277 RepID=A0ABS9ZTT7_9SPHI|nr:helix-turn-helix transcriptional regulator [Pedobacter montanisoli]MCJ0742026.1 helix-turn-helix transcriptional regulator [Pedobacter montanisoli]